MKTAAATKDSTLAATRELAEKLLDSAQKKLYLMGMSKDEVAALKSNGAAQENLYMPGNSGKAWVYITVYEFELGLVKEGQDVTVDALAFPGIVFKGKVTALTPVLDKESRSLKVRVEVNDNDARLRPEMFVNAKILVDLGMKLAIPEEALLDSGIRKIVYVVKNDRFSAHEVTLGPKAGGYYEVLSGLIEGDEIVTSGNFLIDAESKLKGAL